MIEIKDVSKSFPSRTGRRHVIFDNISFSLESGRKYAILGKNGSGKSSLINMIAGIQMPDKGKIIKTLSTSWPVGFSGKFQGSLTGKENIEFLTRIFGVESEKRKEILDYCKSWTNLANHFYEPVKTYSSGMIAKLSFAASMSFDFDFYLLDEITATGDMFFAQKAKETLRQKLASRGFIIVSHSVGDIRDLCTNFATIEHKKIVFYNSFNDALKSYKQQN